MHLLVYFSVVHLLCVALISTQVVLSQMRTCVLKILSVTQVRDSQSDQDNNIQLFLSLQPVPPSAFVSEATDNRKVKAPFWFNANNVRIWKLN